MSNYFPVEDDCEPQLHWLEIIIDMVLVVAWQFVCQTGQLLMSCLRALRA